ncbi:MAG: aminoglycoside phosphotransferase family protein, partial [Caulobacteraceae bacterium]
DAEPARESTPAMWRERYRQGRRTEIYRSVEGSRLARIDRFYDAYVDRPSSRREAVIHGDLGGDHLLAGQEGPLGIIDLGDACLGDPAYDFTFFFAWGERPARRIAELYDPERRDPGLLDRARWSYARSRIEKLRRGRDEAVIAEVEKTLARLGL